MIKDSIKNAGIYHGLNPRIDAVLETISNGKFSDLESGRYDIRGDDIFCLIQEYETRSEGRLEAHNRYIDIQVVIRGSERIDYSDRSGLIQDGDLDESSDIGFFHGKGDPIFLKQGDFAIFFPGDAHAPGLQSGRESSDVRKAVYKILL